MRLFSHYTIILSCFFVLVIGVFAAAHDLKTEWVVIKGISHYADCSASLTEEWIPFASAMAASVVKNILSEPIIFEEWPHYQSTINGTRIQRGGIVLNYVTQVLP